jgi:hypothetical protein
MNQGPGVLAETEIGLVNLRHQQSGPHRTVGVGVRSDGQELGAAAGSRLAAAWHIGSSVV